MDEREQMRRWKVVGPMLEAQRHADIRNGDNRKIVAMLSGMFDHAIRNNPIRETSGLVEMQAIFAKARQSIG